MSWPLGLPTHKKLAPPLDARLIKKLRVENPQSFCNYFRMEPIMYDELMQIERPRIEKHDTNMRKAFRFSLECDPNDSNAVRMLYDSLECS